MSDPDDSSADAVSRSAEAAASGTSTRSAARRKFSGFLWLMLMLALTAALSYGWYRFGPALRHADTSVVPLAAPAAKDPAPVVASDLTALRRSLDDAAGVNRALREQVLGLTQRVGLLEDGLAGVERGAAPGVDAVRLAEADFLLRLGEERLRLFGDVSGARVSFELADEQLSQVSDPRATSVRQTLALERDALAAIAIADVPVILGRLDRLAAQAESWPLKGRIPSAPAALGETGKTWWSRGLGALDRYFRVRRTDPAERASGGPLLRERLQLDFSRARLLLLRGQGDAARTALETARADLQAQFDESDEEVARAIAVIGELLAAPLSPTLPSLGESRRELARLRGVTLRGAFENPTTAASNTQTAIQPAATSVATEPQSPAQISDGVGEVLGEPVEDPGIEPGSDSGDDAVPDDSDAAQQEH